MCDRLIGGMLWCGDVPRSLIRAHPPERIPVFVTADQQATSVFFGGVMLSESGSIRECMCDDGKRKSALAL